MEDMKKRKMDEATNGGGSGGGELSAAAIQEHLRSLLDPLNKSQLVDLLSRLGSQYPSIAEEIKSLASADPVHRKLFVRGLAWNTTSETLCAAFQMHGEIEEGAVIFDKATGKSRGYGFITYKHMESARSALAAPGKMIDGRMAVCNLACEGLVGASATPDLAQRKLYIGGLSPEITSEMLLSVFSRHGEIEEGSVAYDKDTNESRGFGFVTYKTAEAAKKAIDDPQKFLGGRTIIVKFADTHKGKTMQTQLPAPMVAVPVPAAAAYAQPGKGHSVTASIGYTYPQNVASYPAYSYPSPPTAPAPYPAQPAQYPTQSQISYGPAAVKKDSPGLSPPTPVGMGGYPYYLPKQ
uniref:RRM domain-containing protein n=2 Tax=Rhizophora mucronata TaxID=61149 RepID=A0A2P2IY52_RHIMU